jgi:hypothetical protein
VRESPAFSSHDVARHRGACSRDLGRRLQRICDPRLLELHADMLQELGATLDSLARDVDMFARAITLVLEQRATVPGR